MRLNITDDQGVLLGQIDLSDDDLRHPESIGDRVIEQLPTELRPVKICPECNWALPVCRCKFEEASA